jgi:hypothetical protein
LTLLLGFEIFRFGICKLSFAGAPHCVINKYYKNYWTNLSDFMEKQKWFAEDDWMLIEGKVDVLIFRSKKYQLKFILSYLCFFVYLWKIE